jgi:hypothetical protein
VADAVERGLRVGGDRVEERPERRFPGRILGDFQRAVLGGIATRSRVASRTIATIASWPTFA